MSRLRSAAGGAPAVGHAYGSSGSAAQGAAPHAGCDERIGRFFRDARAYMQLSSGELAHRLATSPAVIAAFEAGALASFPPWPETRRLVEGYAALARFDPRPLLDHVYAQLQHVQRPATAAMPVTSAPQPRSRPVDSRSRQRRNRRIWRVTAAVGVVTALVIGTYWGAHARPAPLIAAINVLPAPAANLIRAGMDGLVTFFAPRRDGLRWIDVSDPRTRKADKLQTARQ